jgi:uncharacterized protein (UPF0333 family)
MKGQISIDFILVILSLIILLGFLQSFSDQMSLDAAKISTRSQAKAIITDLAGLMEAIPSNGSTTINNYLIPLISLKDKKISCDITIASNVITITFTDGTGSEQISITESTTFLNNKTITINPVSPKCGEKINLSA